MANDISGPDTKSRYESPKGDDFKPESCDSGGKYQELPTLGAFCEVTEGTRLQRLHERNYSKEHHKEKPSLGDTISSIVDDTRGPPFENVSQPKRIF